ncbi:MAG TPA: ClpX C4-type zinc finger protein [Myxococcaceae bacterium]|jgi:hypothetical protein|nr:ClpX C4-type zinc finger protein [Myxococcaceae bacterium]
MPEHARELVRSAQEAERAGDLGRAEALLERAAAACDLQGRTERASQLRRHARRLAATLPGEPGRHLVERAPVLADPASAAWCSFCCRPDRDVGPLVAGAAGAFICGACVRQAEALVAGAGGGERG